jgi:hypothetical protein
MKNKQQEPRPCQLALQRWIGASPAFSDDVLRYSLSGFHLEGLERMLIHVNRTLKRNEVFDTDRVQGRIVAALDGIEVRGRVCVRHNPRPPRGGRRYSARAIGWRNWSARGAGEKNNSETPLVDEPAAGGQDNTQIPDDQGGVPVVDPTHEPRTVHGHAQPTDPQSDDLRNGHTQNGRTHMDEFRDKRTCLAGADFEADQGCEKVQQLKIDKDLNCVHLNNLIFDLGINSALRHEDERNRATAIMAAWGTSPEITPASTRQFGIRR